MVHDKSNSVDLYVFVMQAEAEVWAEMEPLNACLRSSDVAQSFVFAREEGCTGSKSQRAKVAKSVWNSLFCLHPAKTHTRSLALAIAHVLSHTHSLSLNHLFFHPPRKFSLFNASEANRAFCLSSIVGRKTSSQSSRKLFRLLDWFDLENLELVFLSFFQVSNCVPWLKEHQKLLKPIELQSKGAVL